MNLLKRTETKLVACWAASWGAGLGVLWLGAPAGDPSPAFMLGVALIAILAAVAAWQAVVRLWPE